MILFSEFQPSHKFEEMVDHGTKTYKPIISNNYVFICILI